MVTGHGLDGRHGCIINVHVPNTYYETTLQIAITVLYYDLKDCVFELAEIQQHRIRA